MFRLGMTATFPCSPIFLFLGLPFLLSAFCFPWRTIFINQLRRSRNTSKFKWIATVIQVFSCKLQSVLVASIKNNATHDTNWMVWASVAPFKLNDCWSIAINRSFKKIKLLQVHLPQHLVFEHLLDFFGIRTDPMKKMYIWSSVGQKALRMSQPTPVSKAYHICKGKLGALLTTWLLLKMERNRKPICFGFWAGWPACTSWW